MEKSLNRDRGETMGNGRTPDPTDKRFYWVGKMYGGLHIFQRVKKYKNGCEHQQTEKIISVSSLFTMD